MIQIIFNQEIKSFDFLNQFYVYLEISLLIWNISKMKLKKYNFLIFAQSTLDNHIRQ